MKYGIALLSVIPLRKEPSHRSEMVSQLLFGETYSIVNSNASWLSIKCDYDDYEGWIDVNQHHELEERTYLLSSKEFGVAFELLSNVSSGHYSEPAVIGSSLPFFDGLNFKIGKEKFV